MKRIFLSSLILSFFISTYGQDKPKTLLDTDPEDISGFGSVLFTFMPIDGELATLTGGGGAVLLDNTFYIGGYGLGGAEKKVTVNGANFKSRFSHGGLWLGYLMKPIDLLHLGVDTKLGWGSIRYTPETGGEQIRDRVFVFAPQLIGEINLAYWFKVNAGIGYQKTIGVDESYFKKTAFDGPTFSISLLFGWFN